MANCIDKPAEQESHKQSTSATDIHSESRSLSPPTVLTSQPESKDESSHQEHSCANSDSFEQFYHQLQSKLQSLHSQEAHRTFGKEVHLRPTSIRVSTAECERVGRSYFTLRSVPLTERTKHSLTSHAFNHWLYSDAQLIHCLKHMFLDLKLNEACQFPVEVLEAWLLAVYGHYNDVPFHNFKHAFAVTQMMYSIIKQAQLAKFLSSLDLLVLLFSALSHDLDHPGFTNSYQVNAHSWLALRYNDISPLENHHSATAFELISVSSTNILCGLSQAQLLWFRKAVIKCILATDMAAHNDCSKQFHDLLPKLIDSFNSSNHSTSSFVDQVPLRHLLDSEPEIRLTLMLMLLKVCDISNEIRPAVVSDPWLGCLLEEFFYQANAEKECGLPVAPHMDPEKVTRSTSQLGFLNNILIPLLEDLVRLFPKLQHLLRATRDRVSYYLRMGEKQTRSCSLDIKRGDASLEFADIEPTLTAGRSFSSPSSSNPRSFSATRDTVFHPDGSKRLFSETDSPEATMDVDLATKLRCTTDSSGQLAAESRAPSHPDSFLPLRSDPSDLSADSDCILHDPTEWSPDNVPSRKSSTGSMVLANS